jgi:hypothetical protein
MKILRGRVSRRKRAVLHCQHSEVVGFFSISGKTELFCRKCKRFVRKNGRGRFVVSAKQ